MTKPVISTAVSLVRHFEGLYLNAYLCPAGVPTIGYGHTKGVKMGQTITPEQADAFLAADLAEAAEVVDFFVTVPLTDAQRGALASFVFNLGAGNLRSSTLLKLLNKGDYEGAANQFGVWIKATVGGKKKTLPGLVARRAAEEALFRGMDWTAPAADQRMPQAVQPAGPKPMAQSRTVQAGGIGLGLASITAGAQQAKEAGGAVRDLIDSVPDLGIGPGWIAAGILAVAVAFMLWRRYGDSRAAG